MANKYTIDISHNDDLVGVKLFKNGEVCTFEDVWSEDNAQIIVLDLLAQAYVQGALKN
jgi:hypothetical protein